MDMLRKQCSSAETLSDAEFQSTLQQVLPLLVSEAAETD